MKKKKFLLIIAVSFWLGIPSYTLAQEALTASGGTFADDAGSISYSIGQVVYTTAAGVNGIVPLGVQQPYKFLMEPGTDNQKAPTLVCFVYPNPTAHSLTLRVENAIDILSANLSFQLYDLEGRLIKKNQITSSETDIQVANLVPAVYQLIVNYNNETKTFKIIKN